MKIKARALRLIALLLSFAVVQISFGPEAWAQLVPRVRAVAAPVGGALAPVAAQMPAASLTAAPLLPISAIDAAAVSRPAAQALAESAAASAPEKGNAAANAPAEAPAAPPAAEAALESGPRTAGVGARMARRVAEIKGFFSGRRDAGETPEGAASDPAATKAMLSRYIGAANGSQAGYEMLASASMPVYLDQTFHKMSLMADLSIVGTFASVVGRQLSPLLVNSMPLKKSYLGMLGATLGAATIIGVLANLQALAVLPLFGLMIVFRMLQAGTATAERTVIPSVLGKDQTAMESLRGTKQSWSEVASVLVQNGAALIVVMAGTATANLLIAPLFYVAALGLVWFSLKIPKEADEARMAAWREKTASAGTGALARVKNALKTFVSQIGLGSKVVMRDPALRASAMITMFIMLFNVMTYSLLAPTYAKFAIGPGMDSSLGAPIMGLVAGLFSFGGLFAGKLVFRHAQEVKAKYGDDLAAASEAARVSAMRWLKYGSLGFLAAGAMALPLPVVGPLIHLGAYAAYAAVAVTAILASGTVLAMWRPKLGLALALAPVVLAFPLNVALTALSFFGFGLVIVIASLKNDSLFDRLVQERAPADYANAASFVGAFSMFAGMLGLAALKFLTFGALPLGIPSPVPAFTGLTGIWPFVAIFAGLAVPAMAGVLYFASRLNRLTAPDAANKK